MDTHDTAPRWRSAAAGRVGGLARLVVGVCIALVPAGAADASAPALDAASQCMPASAGGRDPWLWPFDRLSPWNHPLGSNAVFAGDDDRMTVVFRSARAGLNYDAYSMPMYLAADDDPITDVLVLSPDRRTVRYRIPDRARPSPGTDGHVHVVDPGKAFVHETWRATRSLMGAWRTDTSKIVDLAGSGIARHSWENIGTRAYGGSAIGGLIRTWEVEDAGEIRHALAFTLTLEQLTPGAVWPATASDPPEKYSGVIPMGTLFAIKPDVDLASLDLNAAGLMVATALQRFGGYVVDAGAHGPVFFAEPDLPREHVRGIRDDLPTIRSLMYPVLNNAADNVGGGGQPRAPFAPQLARGQGAHTFELAVVGTVNDAVECSVGGNVFSRRSNLVFGDAGSSPCAGERIVGLRFQDLPIPAGVAIESAVLELTTDEPSSEPSVLAIRAQASDDASKPASRSGDLSSRPRTDAVVEWKPAAWTSVGERHDSPQLAAVIQEVVDRPGWSSGGDMVLLVDGEGRRTATAYDLDPDAAPRLRISWRWQCDESMASRR